jgi:dTDP-4-dehydrorhamnose 3,5-epimerase-like enzyme
MSLIKTIDLKEIGDDRGSLVAIEENKTIPFPVKRVYYIFGTKPDVARGFHAHKVLKQLAICVSGSCRMILDDGNVKEEVVMNSPGKGIVIEGMVWREMHDFSEDCVLLVLASEPYNEADYIRSYKEFRELACE